MKKMMLLILLIVWFEKCELLAKEFFSMAVTVFNVVGLLKFISLTIYLISMCACSEL